MSTQIQVYLSEQLPDHYLNPAPETGEQPVKDAEELKWLYANKYGSFGEIQFHMYDGSAPEAFIDALNDLFEAQGKDTQADPQRLAALIHRIVPLVVVDNEIISQGVYPDLTTLRGGSNSVSRGGSGHQH